MTGAAILGSSLVSGLFGSDAAKNAADKSAEATMASVAEQRRQYDQTRADQQPWMQAGTGAINRLGAGVMANGEFGSTMPFDFRYDANADPGTAFRMSEGVKALDRSAASRGGLLSGATLRGVERYAQDLGSQEFQNAFNRYTTGFNANAGERNQLFNRLSGVAGTGQMATNTVDAQGAATASNIGNAYMTDAANQSNAGMAAAGMRSSAFSGGANALGRVYGNYGRRAYGDGSGNYAPVEERAIPV